MSPARQSAEDLLGTVLEGAYRIERLVGEGGMGAVYEAAHLRLGTRVAVKVMARELAANPEALARFHREALVTSGLGHPHIVQVLDFSTTPTGEPFLAMEFLEGEDLEHRLRRVRRLPIADVVHILKQVASALAATHAKAIVHRDLKPGNIFLLTAAGENDFVKVLDFGISKVRSASTKLTRTSSVMGTPNYMSPEQAKGHIEDIDERTDQWALACIVWECLSGEGPFWGENVPSILFQIVHEQPSALAPKVAGLPSQVEEVLLRALAKDKNDRFASVSDFALALERASGAAVSTVVGRPEMLARPEQVPDHAPVKPTTFSHTAGELDALVVPRSRLKWTWVLAAGAALGLVLAAFLFFRPGPAAKTVVASPPPVAVAPPTPSPPAPPPRAEPPAAPPPSVQEIKPETPAPEAKAETSHRAREVKPAKKKPPPAKKDRSQENQDRWRIDE
jgi:serine/threonine-protein kinase